MKVAILVAEGFEEIETSVTYDVLKRAGIEVLTAGLKPGPVTGSRGLRIVCDTVVDEMKASALDALIIPGGYPGYVNLGKSAVVLNLIRTMASAGKDLASICA
ncbi:MAG: DJ-1/PfpI family protein, partial [Dehalococcoidales bacterium]|nr:DJ-1/PfpI family protein [Dehalococcoidales bacterium]